MIAEMAITAPSVTRAVEIYNAPISSQTGRGWCWTAGGCVHDSNAGSAQSGGRAFNCGDITLQLDVVGSGE
jgi:hypothetical protein